MNEINFNEIVSKINSLKNQMKKIIVAVDGPSASGKTTFASVLAVQLKADVLHMDDFYLPFELRTEERYNTPGGNVHYERLAEEVLKPLSENRDYVYRAFDCKTMSYKNAEIKYPSAITIIEGSYSCHPAIMSYYDFKLYLEVSSDKQMKRIILRNGTDKAQDFKNKWIPLENMYFEYYDIKSKCDMVLSGEEFCSE